RRWVYFFEVSLLAIVAFCALFILSEFLGRYTRGWFTALPESAKFAGRCGLALALIAVILRLSPIHLTQFRYVHRYPATWLAIGAGFLATVALDGAGMLGEPVLRPPWWEWPILAIVALTAAAFVRWNTAPNPES